MQRSEPPRQAVLVIDVQQAFLEGEHRAFEVERVIAAINDVTAQARKAAIPTLFVQHEAVSGPFRRGTRGWELAEGLQVEQGDLIVPKQCSDAFHETALAEALRSVAARELVVCGMQSDYCVDSTVRRALALGFDVRLVQDAVTTLDNGVLSAPQITAHHLKTLAGIQSYPGKAFLCAAREALAP